MEYQEVIRYKLLSMAELKFSQAHEGARKVLMKILLPSRSFREVRSNFLLVIINKALAFIISFHNGLTLVKS